LRLCGRRIAYDPVVSFLTLSILQSSDGHECVTGLCRYRRKLPPQMQSEDFGFQTIRRRGPRNCQYRELTLSGSSVDLDRGGRFFSKLPPRERSPIRHAWRPPWHEPPSYAAGNRRPAWYGQTQGFDRQRSSQNIHSADRVESEDFPRPRRLGRTRAPELRSLVSAMSFLHWLRR